MVGIGLMGHGIAGNLLKHGHTLTVFEHPGNQPLEALQARGAQVVASLHAVAAAADVIVLCVTGSPQVEAVVLGEDGLLARLRAGTVIVDCSTAVPASTERVAAAVKAAGGRFADAPMTRTPREAEEGRLNLLVGADEALFAELRPLLACFAENITHCGGVGAGHRMKLLHNFVSLGGAALIAEAAACARRGGVAPEIFVEVLAKGGGAGVTLERMRPFLEHGDDSGLKFALSNAVKDLGYYATMAADSGAVQTIAQAVRLDLELGVQALGGERFVPALVDALAAARVDAPARG
ncbi:MAG: 2-hydroxy-3-oxopropionate reductase [Rubrivivax sp. SCN 71-131]|nr:MAG: 2-hydroxy-3-oxopropionate reductase [Rubrivivax sp. SCN 71-131]